MSKKREFLFSVVMPIYNTASYLSEAIDSLTCQTIGFEENIQLILVNDGSRDNSGEICRKYADLYPENVIYIEQENSGVSAARNNGLKYAKGRYINFLDSDDKWSAGAFGAAKRFFEQHPEISLVAAKLIFFDADEGGHPLNYKFAQERVVDLNETPDYPQLGVNSSWIKRELLGDRPFNETLKISEDACVLSGILLRSLKFGVLKRPTYFYRRRQDGSSAINNSRKFHSWYFETPRLYLQKSFDLSRELYGYIHPYIQYAAMYELRWRLANPFNTPLSEGELDIYKKELLSVLRKIDDTVIINLRAISRKQRLAFLALKRGISTYSLRENLIILKQKVCTCIGGGINSLWDFELENKIYLSFINLCAGKIYLEGRLGTMFLPEHVKITAETKNETCSAEIFERKDLTKDSFFEKNSYVTYGFKVFLPIQSFTLQLYICNMKVESEFVFEKFFPLSEREYSYSVLGKYSLMLEQNKFIVKQRDRRWFLRREYLYERSIRKQKDAEELSALSLRRKMLKKALSSHKTRIWLISDRTYQAGDNGEALFSYLMGHPVSGVKVYFLLEEDSPDFERMKKIGPVIPYFSEEHKKLYFSAEKLISSSADDPVLHPFKEEEKFVNGFAMPDIVFLQHGVIKNDLSGWLRRWNKNIKLFCTAAPKERDSIIENEKYGYSDKEIKLTGLARHDKLILSEGRSQKRLLIAPTWRQWLSAPIISGTGIRAYSPKLKDSDYFKFYDRLLNDTDIAQALEKEEYTAHFLLHPAFINNIEDFSSSYCEIMTEYNYSQEFLQSAFMLTDYSSVVFDFAILKRPVLYAQFDREEFMDRHLYSGGGREGYFDDITDGFGPVCETYEKMKEELIKMIDNPVMEQKYKDRVDSFFGPLDGHACERIVQAILDMDS